MIRIKIKYKHLKSDKRMQFKTFEGERLPDVLLEAVRFCGRNIFGLYIDSLCVHQEYADWSGNSN